jgi:hypothetical protein
MLYAQAQVQNSSSNRNGDVIDRRSCVRIVGHGDAIGIGTFTDGSAIR